MKKNPHFGILAAVTYGLVAVTTLLAVAAYFYFRSEVRQGDQPEPKALRRIQVGTIWVPVYAGAAYLEPHALEQKAISTGSVKFRTKDPVEQVLAFYQDNLREGALVTVSKTDAGGSVQSLRSGGRISVTVSVTRASENTTGEIRTISRTGDLPHDISP